MTDDRLTAIESRCKALGWNFHLDDSCDNPRYEIEGHAAEWQLSGYGDLEVDLQAAERLLSLYEPGPVVEIGKCPDVILNGPYLVRKIAVKIPKELHGKYKLVRWEGGDE